MDTLVKLHVEMVKHITKLSVTVFVIITNIYIMLMDHVWIHVLMDISKILQQFRKYVSHVFLLANIVLIKHFVRVVLQIITIMLRVEIAIIVLNVRLDMSHKILLIFVDVQMTVFIN